ncbi:MAG: hypothetical protein ACOCR6_03885 [archaeon]
MAAALGALAMFTLLGGATAWVGQEALSDTTIFEMHVGGLLIIFGSLVALDRAPSLSLSLPKRPSSVLGFGLFGAGYALAEAGCVALLFLAVVAGLSPSQPSSGARSMCLRRCRRCADGCNNCLNRSWYYQ